MNIKVSYDEQKLPLLHNMDVIEPQKSTAHLANLLPTGTVLSFQFLSPIFTNQGKCDDSVTKLITLSLCGASCFLLCFTDSFRDKKGHICYGFSTFKGLWIIDGSTKLSHELDEKYQLRFIDFMHAIMSILVFSAIALFDHNVVKCLFPSPSHVVKCFLLCFTDSFRDKKGHICYGFSTFKGLWIIDGSTKLSHELDEKYQLRFIDFMHAIMSILVFSAIALFDHNVVKCLFPSPSHEMHEILTALPVGIGVLCSMLFVAFPTQRHGIGFPLSTN